MAKLVIDIGHGVNTFPPDKGVIVDGKLYAEHTFNSLLAIALAELLEEDGHEVIMYQKPFSNDIPLLQRTDYYEEIEADLVWSIHANANNKDHVGGRCAFYWYKDSEAKKLAELFVEEVKKAGYSTHGNGLHASQYNSWTNLHICRENYDNGIVAVLTENGFMTNDVEGTDDDFELIFGSKQEQYVKDMAKVHYRAITRYLGKEPRKDAEVKKPVAKPKPSKPAPKPSTKPKEYKGNSIVDYLIFIGEDHSKANRKKLANEYGVKNYDFSAKKNLELLNAMRKGKPVSPGKSTVKPAPVKADPVKPTAKKSSYTGNSIVDYLVSIGENPSKDNRKKLAKAYGIKNYNFSAQKNLELLNAMRNSSRPNQAPIRTSSYKGTSIVDYLNSIKENPSKENRKRLAKAYGVKNYNFSAQKNLELLRKMRGF